MSVRSKLLACVMMASAFAGAAPAEVPTRGGPPLEEALVETRDSIIDLVASGAAPSVSVLVLRDGAPIWEESIGWANRECATPATPDHSYALGSLSKSITATALMTLVEAGHAEIDDPVTQHLGSRSIDVGEWDGTEVTIGRILSMSAGIPHGWDSRSGWTHVPRSTEAKAAVVRDVAFVAFAPGEVMEYSNYSYGVAELLIERVSGVTYAQYLDSALFEPLGMAGAMAEHTPSREGGMASPHDDDGSVIPHYQFLPAGAAGGYASVRDLGRFAMLHLGLLPPVSPPVLGDETITLMHHYGEESGALFGLGWGRAGGVLITNGAIRGANSALALVREQNLAVVALVNGSGRQADEIALGIVGVLAPEAAASAFAAIEAYGREVETPYAPSATLEGVWEGELDSSPGTASISLTFPTDGPPAIAIGDGPPSDLRDSTYNSAGELRGDFTADISGRIEREAGTHEAKIALKRRGDRMYGYVLAMFDVEAGAVSEPIRVSIRRQGD